MLFDLRSKGRRRTVQTVYLGLALLIGLGLVGFGVGAGNGLGGIFTAFNSNGSGSNQGQVVSSEVQAADKQVKANPASAAAWSSMLQARWTAAGQGSNYNSATRSFTASGNAQLAAAAAAWQRYLQLTKSPDPNLGILAARTYGALGQYGNAAGAWDLVSIADPTALSAYECLTVTSYAAGQTRKGDLAMAKVLTMVPRANRTTLKTQLGQAKTSSSTAKQLAQSSCQQ
jgi:hypothetical protein